MLHFFLTLVIKPDNILIGGLENDELFLIDFGLAKKFRNKSEHVPYRRHGMVGTVRYASINTHREIQQSRRDDLESLGYILVSLAGKRLPWQGIRKVLELYTSGML